ncbi:MAG: ABC transporter substrate-binding protein [Flavobacterium sp.]|nr:ABC transporter substrate-binding protein [Flavobacterium sp.]
MNVFFRIFLLLFISNLAHSQSAMWKGYFSYNEIKDLSQSSNAIFAAAENAIFSKNLNTNVLKTVNTVDGLSGNTITALYHSVTANKTIVGYQNGLIIVVNQTDGSMTNVVDIINKQISPNIKKVNHFAEYNGIVYVSCDFGIVQYNLNTLQFGNTFFIGDNGAEIIVSQSTVFDGKIYAATNFGLRSATVTNPNLVDFSQWTQILSGSWSGVEAVGDELLAVNASGQINRFNGTGFNVFSQLPLPAVDFRRGESNLIVTTPNRVYVYNEDLTLINQITNASVQQPNVVFTAATTIADRIFIGTMTHGVLSTYSSNPTSFESISPDGPLRNNMFAINGSTGNLWAVYGDYSVDYAVDPVKTHGVSKFTSNGWLNIPYDEVHEPGKEAYNLSRITVNPNNENDVYISSYFSGLLRFDNDQLITQYDQSNSGLESINSPNYISVRIGETAFDRAGNLWMTNALIQNPLKVLRTNGTWQSYNMEGVVTNWISARYGKLTIDKNDTKWIATAYDGLIGFNENGNVFKTLRMGSEAGNLPINDARVAAVDNRNALWIGTRRGLRVLPSVDRFRNEGQLTANPIIIIEDGVAQELLYEQFIMDIVVDGANNKWIATADAGVFMVSPNGQETIHRFTAENSPLPSNNVNDIDINGATGEVFIATSRGLVSFKGISTDANQNLNNVVVYPNPVRPEYNGTVKISGLIDDANVKIADIGGNLVYETFAEGGTIEWDTTAFGKYKVASGVYMIFISSSDGTETKVKKVMIIR